MATAAEKAENLRRFKAIFEVVGDLKKLREGIWQQEGSAKNRTMWREVIEACAAAKQAVQDVARLHTLVEQLAAAQNVTIDYEKLASLAAEKVAEKFDAIERTTSTTSVSLREGEPEAVTAGEAAS